MLAEAPDQRADQQRLPQGIADAIDRQRDPDHGGIPAEPGLAVIGPDRGIDVHRDRQDQEHQQRAARLCQTGDGAQRASRVGTGKAETAAAVSGHGLGQDKQAKDQVGAGHGCCGVERGAGIDPCQHPADQRAKHEAHPEARADQPEAATAIRGWGDVGDEGGGGGIGRRSDARDDPRGQQQPDAGRSCQHQVIGGHHRQRDQQHRAASKAVGQAADRRAEQELHHCKRGGKHPAPQRRLAKVAAGDRPDQVGHDRKDQADADGIKRHRDQDEGQGKTGGGMGHDCPAIAIRRRARASGAAKKGECEVARVVTQAAGQAAVMAA